MELNSKKRRGRPTMPDAVRKVKKLAVPVTQAVHAAVVAAAEARGVSISSYLRDLIQEAMA